VGFRQLEDGRARRLTMDAHISDITKVIQLAVAPVFLLTAVGTIINALTGRLARAIDRRRVVEARVLEIEDADERRELLDEVALLAVRTSLVLWSIALAVLAAILVCLLIGTAFVGAFIALDLSRTVAVLFIGAVTALTLCLIFFMREVFLAALSVKHAVRPWYQRSLLRSQATAKPK
jgi:hypothetical protein